MATLTPVNISRAGVLETLVAASAGGDSITNDGQTFIVVALAPEFGPRTLTFDITSTVDGQAVTDRTVVFAAGERKLIGPFPPSVYGVALGITYSSEVGLTLNPFRLTPALP